MKIDLDFTGIRCDLGHINAYTNKVCEICGEDFADRAPHIDPKVEIRKEFMSPIFDLIDKKQSERRLWLRQVKRNEISKLSFNKNPFGEIQRLISIINDEIEMNLVDIITIHADDIKNKKTLSDIKKIKNFVEGFFNILHQAEQQELKYPWKNMNKRLINLVRNFLEGIIELMKASIAPNLEKSQELSIVAQEKIDCATKEIIILNRIIDNVLTINENSNLYSEGAIDQKLLLSMIFNHDEIASMQVGETNELVEYYFRELIGKNQLKTDITKLSPYMFMGISLFDDSRYLNKIRISTNILQKAMQMDTERFKKFFSKYIVEFQNIHNKLQKITTEFVFILSHNPSDEVLMMSSIRLYKDLSEGIYKYVARILYYSTKILNKKNFEDDDVLLWLKFSEIVAEFDNQRKHRLDYLTEGVEKIIRNAEAHADYEVKDKYIHLRNIDSYTKEIKEKYYIP